jgi:hypothetical protein
VFSTLSSDEKYVIHTVFKFIEYVITRPNDVITSVYATTRIFREILIKHNNALFDRKTLTYNSTNYSFPLMAL